MEILNVKTEINENTEKNQRKLIKPKGDSLKLLIFIKYRYFFKIRKDTNN